MNPTITDAFQVTIVAMTLVFFVLFCLMILMQVVAKVIGNTKKSPVEKPIVSHPEPVLSMDLANIAVLTALAHAADQESGKHYQVVDVKRLA